MDRKRRKPVTVSLTERRSCNLLSFVFTCCVLLLAFNFANCNFTSRINKISDDLHKALDAVLEMDGPNYTDIYENNTYYSDTKFHPKGMSGLYNVTTMFMNLIVSQEIYPEGFIKVVDGKLVLGSLSEQWQTLLAHYAALIAVVIVLLIFGILMPICGLCFCCCRCCGKCGARSKPFDKKGDLCKKICLATLLIGMGTLMLFGVVCAFVSNQHMQDGTNELPTNLKNSVRDADVYIQSTAKQIHLLLDVNYKEFEQLLFVTLDDCSNIISNQLEEYSNATALTEVFTIVNGLDEIKADLSFIKTVARDMRHNASELSDKVRGVKNSLVRALHKCNEVSQCSDMLSNYINPLGTEIDFSNLPDISQEIDNLNEVLNLDIAKTLKEGQQALDNIQVEINRTISSQIPKVKKSINTAGKEVIAGGSNVTTVLKKVSQALDDYVEEPLKDIEENLNKYSPYRYYVGLGVSCSLLIITLCVTLGLVCGICGKRPDAYSDDCCNKGAGSRFLMIGVGIMFLFAIILVVVTIVHFFLGILAQRLICDSFRHPNTSQVVKLVDEVMNLKGSLGLDVDINWVLNSCNKNLSIYNVFKLQNLFDINEVITYLDKFEINQTLADLTEQINANTSVDILNDKAEAHLKKLVSSGIADIKYDKFIDEYATNFTTIDLDFLASKLDELVKIVQDKVPSQPNLPADLIESAKNLRAYQKLYVVPMTMGAKESTVIAQKLKESLKFGKESFEVAINTLIEELKAAEHYLRYQGPSTMTAIAQNFGYGIEKQVRSYLYRVINNTKDKVGQCGPLSAGLNATLIATCDKILLPWNGFWFSLMWCLLLFIPTIIFSTKLATLYQKYEPYPGPLVEAEYLYDAYADRDNIPLNSTGNSKRSKLKHKKKQKRYERGAFGPDATGDGIARDMPGGSHYQDTRYADMAPKHWDEFPAGGPPQYQRAPAEYERPPPYYFPGTEQQ
ncbi:hypothetical protein RI129_010050 [Pyrocoelia pectoralis]|uniref:Prominin-like protein n=1 Tax=Pyrocoelia pectoralis TaxID=417401 RepID=A0AAN7V795_9COLE